MKEVQAGESYTECRHVQEEIGEQVLPQSVIAGRMGAQVTVGTACGCRAELPIEDGGRR